jgi:hypothetical protein
MPDSVSIPDNQLYSLPMSATDPNADKIIFSADNLPQGSSLVDNNNNTANFSWTPTSAQANTYQVTFRASDGLLSDSKTVAITVLDTIPPQTTISRLPSGWSTRPIIITLTATDKISGVKDTFYSTDGSEPTIKYIAPFTLNTGIYSIKYYSIDNAGNKESIHTTPQVKVDTTPPLTPVVEGSGVWRNGRFSRITASWTSSDPTSGLTEYQYKITERLPTGPIIRNWTSRGTQTSMKYTGLLKSKISYYVSVKAKNGAGQWSQIGYSKAIFIGR